MLLALGNFVQGGLECTAEALQRADGRQLQVVASLCLVGGEWGREGERAALEVLKGNRCTSQLTFLRMFTRQPPGALCSCCPGEVNTRVPTQLGKDVLSDIVQRS